MVRCRPGGEGVWKPSKGTLAEESGDWGLPINERGHPGFEHQVPLTTWNVLSRGHA